MKCLCSSLLLLLTDIIVKKVIVIGCPGSGKSTFARRLKSVTGLPIFHLDMMYWNEDRTTISKEMFLDRLGSAMSNSEWIIDGNYMSSMEMRINECDTVFFLDYPTQVCIDGIEKRKGTIRSDMPWVENGTDEEFVNFIKNFNLKTRFDVISLLKKY